MTRPEDGMLLSEEQETAFNRIIQFCDEGNAVDNQPDIFVLRGFAGTGKTFTLSLAIERIKAVHPTWKICFSAPTHKALKVIRGYCEQHGVTDVFFSTIHSLLGLEVNQSEGRSSLHKRASDKDEPVWNFDLIVLDECSMVGADIWDEVSAIASHWGHHPKFICMGDPAQLPPIGEVISPSFMVRSGASLTEVRRYSGTVAKLVEEYRQNLERVVPVHYRYRPEGNLHILEKGQWLNRLLWQFQQDYDPENPDKVRALAWTNKTVTWLNWRVRQQLYSAELNPVDLPEFILDERVVAHSTFQATSEERVYSSTEGIIRGVELETYESEFAPLENKFKTPLIRIELLWLDVEFPDLGKRYRLPKVAGSTLVEPCQNFILYSEILTHLKRSGSRIQDKGRRSAVWRMYYELLALDTPIRPLYALTVHNSQGSSFGDVYLASLDCEKNEDTVERNKLLYVGASRARNNLTLCI